MITAYALVAGSIAVFILLSLTVYVSTNQRLSQNEAAKQQAVQVAENGIYFYSWYLSHNLNGKNVDQINEFWQSGNPYGVTAAYERDVVNFEGNPYGRYQVDVEPPLENSTIVVVKSTGWTFKHPEIKREIQVRMRRPSWSEFSVLANDIMRFGDGTTIYGPVHSNNGIQFDGVANNLVSSSVESYYDPDSHSTKPGVWTSESDEDEVFLAGKEFPVPAVDFNSITVDLSYMRTQAQSDGIYLGEQNYINRVCSWKFGKKNCGSNIWCEKCVDEEYPIHGYHLTLRTDDTVEIRRVLDYQGDSEHEPSKYKIDEETEPEVRSLPANGLIYADNYVFVDGQIDTAHVTIVSAKLDSPIDTDIYLNDDLLYTNKDGSDTIGLIAENNISVGYESKNEMEVDAAMLAQKGRVGRDNYNGNGGNSNKREKITIYGSIASNKRYGFAWVDDDGKHVSGYSLREIYYDNNLMYTPPPFFPTGSVYQLDQWEEL